MDFEQIYSRAGAWLWVIVAAVFGRLMYHSEQVKRGHRQFFSWTLAWELPVAIAMGIIAHGGCSWWSIDGAPEAGIVAIAGYLGPHAIETLWGIILGGFRKRVGGDDK